MPLSAAPRPKHNTYQGSCNGVFRSFLGPITFSAVPISLGPRGAQNSPVFDMSNDSMNVIIELAASSGVTAVQRKHVLLGHEDQDRTHLRLRPKTCQTQHSLSSLFA